MLTLDQAKTLSELARAGAANGSAATPPAVMVKAWEAIHSFEAWVMEQANKPPTSAPVEAEPEVAEGPQG